MTQKENLVVAVYKTRADAEAAIERLHDEGFDLASVSIIAKNLVEAQPEDGKETGDRMTNWGLAGAIGGGVLSLLVGLTFLVIPGAGALMVAGPLAALLALEGAVVAGGLSAIGAGFYSMGIAKESVVQYETAVQSDKFVLVAHGTLEEVATAQRILKTTTAEDLHLHPNEMQKATSSK